ncbi:MAG: hypothetical protein KF753_20810 [Caldilineaceae bacterium]|nr:hypothetical protein [Caldilineaceae bacterium]
MGGVLGDQKLDSQRLDSQKPGSQNIAIKRAVQAIGQRLMKSTGTFGPND